MSTLRATTILGVRTATQLALAGDGQVTVGEMVLKQSARKIRRLADDRVLAGFAGAVADALTLFDKFEGHLAASQGQLRRAAVELAREWRTDRYLRHLEAQLLIGDLDSLLILSGEGDVIEPDSGVVAIGSGSAYAIAAARALLAHTRLTARQVAEASMAITGELCIFTNNYLVLETIDRPVAPDAPAAPTPRRRRAASPPAPSQP